MILWDRTRSVTRGLRNYNGQPHDQTSKEKSRTVSAAPNLGRIRLAFLHVLSALASGDEIEDDGIQIGGRILRRWKGESLRSAAAKHALQLAPRLTLLEVEFSGIDSERDQPETLR